MNLSDKYCNSKKVKVKIKIIVAWRIGEKTGRGPLRIFNLKNTNLVNENDIFYFVQWYFLLRTETKPTRKACMPMFTKDFYVHEWTAVLFLIGVDILGGN